MQAVTITQITPNELENLIENSIRKILSAQKDSSTIETDQLLTIKEAAEFLHLSVPTLYGYVSRSAIPVSKQGKRLYFSKQELTEWVKTGRKKTIAEINAEANTYLKSKKK